VLAYFKLNQGIYQLTLVLHLLSVIKHLVSYRLNLTNCIKQ